MFTSLKRIIRSGWQNFKRQAALSFATVSIMVIAIFLISSLFLLREITDFLALNLQERVDVSVYFKKDSSEEDILIVKDEISQNPEVKSVEYISREKALERFTERHKNDPVVIESLSEIGENPLLASLNIKAWQASQYAAISSFLEKGFYQEIIEEVDYYQNKEAIDKIFEVSSSIKTAALTASIILGLIAVLVAFNTIRLAIYNSKEEVSIMRLVGASDWFIRGPFVIQGIIVGITATLLSFSIFYMGTLFFDSRFETFLPGFNLSSHFKNNFWQILSLQLITGVGLGIFSSFIAIRKYLKV